MQLEIAEAFTFFFFFSVKENSAVKVVKSTRENLSTYQS